MTQQEPSYADLAAARRPALLRLAVMLTGDAEVAQDLVQATLMNASRHGDRVAGMTAPAAYLRRALVNEHLSWRRKLKRQPPPVPLTVEPPGADPMQRVDLRDQTWRLLATLPKQQRTVLALRYYEDLSDPEIAEVLGCSEGTVRSHASRALATLRAQLPSSEVTS